MRLDPFRIQVLTVSLDSQAILTISGLVAAGLVFRQAARQSGLGLGAGDWWDIAIAAVLGARLLWVVTHPAYYLRQPLQVVVVLDGGLHPLGLALGAAYGVWRLGRPGGAAPWRLAADLAAIGILTTLLFERTGCALTMCGAGPPSDLPWALLRGHEWRAPVALGQVVVLAVALVASAELLRRRGAATSIALAALALSEVVALAAGTGSLEVLLAVGALAAAFLAAGRLARSRSASVAGAAGPGAPGQPGPP